MNKLGAGTIGCRKQAAKRIALTSAGSMKSAGGASIAETEALC